MTPADIIASARVIIQDTLVPYRNSDADMLNYVNQTLKRMAVLRPDLFAEVGEVDTVAGSVIQSLPDGAIRLIDVFYVKDGEAVTEADRESLSRSYPGWVTESAGTPVNFMRHIKNGEKYFLYPRPSEGVVLVAEYAMSPSAYSMDESISQPPAAFLPVAVDGVVYLAESLDAEHVNSGRAKLFLDSFTQSLTVSLQARTVTDTKAAGLKPNRSVNTAGEVI